VHDLEEMLRESLHEEVDGYEPRAIGKEEMLRHRLRRRRALNAAGSAILALTLVAGATVLAESLTHETSFVEQSPLPSVASSITRHPSTTSKPKASKPSASKSSGKRATNPTTTPGVAPSVVVATDKDNGGTVVLRRGQQLRVVLSSTYWQFQKSSNPAVLRDEGQPQVSPQQTSSSGSCVPGQGCGTVTATFLAVSPGRATVTATRTSCGEALRCTGANGQFTLKVVVQH